MFTFCLTAYKGEEGQLVKQNIVLPNLAAVWHGDRAFKEVAALLRGLADFVEASFPEPQKQPRVRRSKADSSRSVKPIKQSAKVKKRAGLPSFGTRKG